MWGSTDPSGGTLARQTPAHLIALNYLSAPVFLVQPDCHIVETNDFGRLFLQNSKILKDLNGVLHVQRRADNATLMDAVRRVHARGQHELIRLLRRTDDVACLVHLAPAHDTDLVVLCVADLRVALPHPPGWTRTLFGFNATTAALAEALADGQSLAEIAASQNLPIGTIRTRLKKLMTQTGTSSQSALVAMLLRASALIA